MMKVMYDEGMNKNFKLLSGHKCAVSVHLFSVCAGVALRLSLFLALYVTVNL